MNSGDFASRFDASMILPQREPGTRPLRRSSPLIEACDAMKRWASSDSDISSENSATALPPACSAAFSAKLAISALLCTTMSSATKLWSSGNRRGRTSPARPSGSIETIGSHQTSADARSPSARSPSAPARVASCGRERPRVPTCQLWFRGRPVRAAMSAQAVLPLRGGDPRPDVGRQRVHVGLEHVRRQVGHRPLELRSLTDDRDPPGERVDVGLPGDQHLARHRVGALVDHALQRADLRDAVQPQQQMLHVARQPRADRCVPDLAEAL